jgi:predicted Zn-dependent peptidase
MARHLLSHDRIISPAELTRHVEAVTIEKAQEVAQQLLDSKASVALVGSGRKSKAQAEAVAAAFEQLRSAKS